MRPLRRELVVATLGAAIFAVACTWPLAPRLGSAGRVDSGDGRFSVWNVGWVAHALTTDPRELYDTNIFYPRTGTLAFSEANLVAGIIAIPVWIATHNALAACNFVILCSFVLSAVSTYGLVRYLSASRAAAAYSAIMFAFCPYVFGHIPHVQLLLTFGLPLVLLALHREIDAPSWPRAVQLGLALALTALSCGYYGVFAGLVTAFGWAWFATVTRRWRDRRFWWHGIVAASVAAAVVLPFFLPFVAVQQEGFARTIADARLFGADWRSYLASPLIIHRWVLPIIGNWRELLFPGASAMILAGVALWQSAHGRLTALASRPLIGFYVMLAVLAAWASFGPSAGLFSALFHAVPFVDWLRAPARFGLLVTLATAVLGGIGLAWLARAPWTLTRRLAVAAILVYASARSTSGALEIVDAPPLTLAERRLSALPPAPVAEFPYFGEAADRHQQTSYMLASTAHWMPLLNGYSDFIPGGLFNDMEQLEGFPSLSAWQVLHDRKARYLLMHWSLYDPARADAVRKSLDRLPGLLVEIVRSGETSLYQIVAWPAGIVPN
jgi:hypothetical protein